MPQLFLVYSPSNSRRSGWSEQYNKHNIKGEGKRESGRQTERKTETKRHRETRRHKERETDTVRDKETQREDRKTQRDKERKRQTNRERQTNRQKETKREREEDKGIERAEKEKFVYSTYPILRTCVSFLAFLVHMETLSPLALFCATAPQTSSLLSSKASPIKHISWGNEDSNYQPRATIRHITMGTICRRQFLYLHTRKCRMDWEFNYILSLRHWQYQQVWSISSVIWDHIK